MHNVIYANEASFKNFEHLEVNVNPQQKSVWLYFNARPRPCFTLKLFEELACFQEILKRHNGRLSCYGRPVDVEYSVIASRHSAFNYGGDLDFFIECLKKKDREALSYYARLAIDGMYINHAGRDLDLTTISLIQGDALGGGFEAALSSHVLIAESNAGMGLPEVLFNMFPGMGAYNLLSQRLTPVKAERMIMSGVRSSAEEMYEEGVVDILADKNGGEEAVDHFISANRHHQNTFRAVNRIRRKVCPLDYRQLLEIGDIWVDAALNLGEREVRIMQRLIHGQTRMAQKGVNTLPIATAGNS